MAGQAIYPKRVEDLPMYFDHPSTQSIHVCLDELKEHHRPALRRMWQQVIDEGDGFGKGEDFSQIEKKIMERTDPRFRGFALTDCSNCAVIAVQLMFPTPLSRSEKPVYAGSFRIVSRGYRGKGISVFLIKAVRAIVSAQYLGGLGRIVVIGHNIVPQIKSDSVFIGSIPRCTNITNKGWFDDNISFIHYEEDKHAGKDKGLDSNYTIPIFGDKARLEATLPMFARHPPPSPSFHTLRHNRIGRITVSSASKDDVWTAQRIIRNNALEGSAFGLDEFTADGVFNEKFFRDCRYWLAREVDSKRLVAVILTGDAGLTRSPGSKQANGAILVEKAFRRVGLGSALLRFCETQACALGYQCVLTDVLACNVAGLSLLRKNGFFTTATLPKACFVSGRGYCDSFVQWKQIKQRATASASKL